MFEYYALYRINFRLCILDGSSFPDAPRVFSWDLSCQFIFFIFLYSIDIPSVSFFFNFLFSFPLAISFFLTPSFQSVFLLLPSFFEDFPFRFLPPRLMSRSSIFYFLFVSYFSFFFPCRHLVFGPSSFILSSSYFALISFLFFPSARD